MRRLLITATALLLLLPLALPATAANGSCNTTLVSQGICRASTNLVLYYDAPLPAFADLRDAIVEEYNYQADLVCASTRQFEPLLNGAPSRIVSAAGQAEDGCTVGQVTPNPQGPAEFADSVIDYELRNRVISWELNNAQAAADDPTTIGTPDVGQ